MRSLAWVPLLLVLLASSRAWSGSADRAIPTMHRTTVSQVTAGLRATHRDVMADPAAQCESAVMTAEYINRLPPRLLAAISLTESGRVDAATDQVRPWPWTINAEGEGRFFATRQDAIAAVRALQSRGVRSIDVGCLQVNLMHHPAAFTSLEEAFDPQRNVYYAARFLNALYLDGKDWRHAVGAYHSETPALAEAYRLLVEAKWQRDGARAVGGLRPGDRQGAYQDFVRDPGRSSQAYGAFTASTLVYGAFPSRYSGLAQQ